MRTCHHNVTLCPEQEQDTLRSTSTSDSVFVFSRCLTLPETRRPTQTRGRLPKPVLGPTLLGTSFPHTARIACSPAREAPRTPSPSASCQPRRSWPISAAGSPRACRPCPRRQRTSALKKGREKEQRVRDTLFHHRCHGRLHGGDDDMRRWSP